MKMIAAMAVLGLAGSAGAQHFSISRVDGSNGVIDGGMPGTGFDVISGEFSFGGTFGSEPSQAQLDAQPNLAYLSYVTIDHGPVEVSPGYDGSNVGSPTVLVASGGAGTTNDRFRGLWSLSGMFVDSVSVNKPGFGAGEELFLGRICYTGIFFDGRLAITIAEGLSPTNGIRIVGDVVAEQDIVEGLGWIDSDEFGNPLQIASTEYRYVIVRKSFQTNVNGTDITVSDIYLQSLRVVPTPATFSLFAFGGFASTRRRR